MNDWIFDPNPLIKQSIILIKLILEEVTAIRVFEYGSVCVHIKGNVYSYSSTVETYISHNFNGYTVCNHTTLIFTWSIK